MLVAQRGRAGRWFGALRGGDGLAGQDRLVDPQAAGPQEAEVRGHTVAGFDQHDVARHELRHRHADALTIPQDMRLGGDEVAHRREGIFRLALLEEANDRIEQHDGEDRAAVNKVPEYGGRESSGQLK